MTPEKFAQSSLDLNVSEHEGDRICIALRGPVSHDTCVGLVHQLLALSMERHAATVTLDLEGVGFIDSQGIGVICELHHELEKRAAKLRLKHLSPTALRIISLMRLDQLIEIG